MAVCSVLKFPVSLLRIPISCHIHLQSAAMNNSIPDRWTEYIPVGKRIPGTRFITFKVPLKKIYDNKLALWQRFSPSDLVKEVEKQNEELGLVVDLTCTNRYYSPQELPKTIMYSKIFTVGQQVPCDGVIAQFKRIVKQYLMQNSENDKLVGVHCTHGLNRTGYLVCRYLIDMLSMEPSEAIEKFNKSRGHSIERSNYLDDLLSGKSRSNPGFAKPQVNNQRQSSKKNANSQQSPCPQQQPRNYSHATDTQRCGPRIRGPPFAQPSVHYKSGQVMGPAHGFPHSGGRYPRGPNRHHPQRPLPHHRDYGVVNGAPPQNYRPSFPQQSDNNPLNDFPARPPRSQQHRNKRPYQRHPGPGLHQKPKKQWQ